MIPNIDPPPLPFNLEQAKAGHRIITRDGQEVEFVAIYTKREVMFPLLVYVGGSDVVQSYTASGYFYHDEQPAPDDLCMSPIPEGFKPVWVDTESRRLKRCRDHAEDLTFIGAALYEKMFGADT